MNSPPLELRKLMGRQKTPKLVFVVAVKNYPEDFDVNGVLSLFPIMTVAHAGVSTAQKRVCQNQHQRSNGKR
jgi:hypothetical protein